VIYSHCSLYWDFPGGRIDDNERIPETLIREISEEVPSLRNVKIGRIIHAARISRYDKDEIGLMYIVYEITADFDEITVSEEHVDYRWIKKNDIPSLESDPEVELSPETEKAALLKAFESSP